MANNCENCEYLHENGNCFAVGGFCTAVPAYHCRLLTEYLDIGLTPKEIEDLQSVRELSPEATYAIDKHADDLIARLDAIIKNHNAPATDMVEVVRCKDCRHRTSSEFCECRPPDAFCSDGERKEDDNGKTE